MSTAWKVVSQPRSVFTGGAPGVFLLECELGRDVREEVARLAVTSGWGLLELKAISMTLEDVFLQLTRHEEGLEPDTVATSVEAAGQPV